MQSPKALFTDLHFTFELWHNILLSCIRVTAEAVQVVDGALANNGLPPKLPVVDDLDHQRRHVQFLLGQELGVTELSVTSLYKT